MKRYYHTLIVLTGITVVIYTGVDIFYRLVRHAWQVDVQRLETEPGRLDTGASDPSLKEYRVIVDRGLFGAGGGGPTAPPPPAPLESLKPTTLDIALLGTVAGGEDASRAVIEERDSRRQGLYKVGDTVKGATLTQILRGKVVLRVGDSDQVLSIQEPVAPPRGTPRESTPSPELDGDHVLIDAQALRQSPRGALQLLSEIRVRPNVEDGRSEGLLVGWIKPGSPFSRLGLGSGDILRQVNGRPANSLDDIVSLYKELESDGRATLVITRGGETKTLSYILQ